MNRTPMSSTRVLSSSTLLLLPLLALASLSPASPPAPGAALPAAVPASPVPGPATETFTVDAQIVISWLVSAGSGCSSLLPYGPNLDQHPYLVSFKNMIADEYFAEIPESKRNSWAFESITVGPSGNKPESEVHGFLQTKVAELNTARDQQAAASNLPNPPDFALLDGEPLCIEYDYWNSTVTCKHTYRLSLGGALWQLADTSIPATAEFSIEVSWDSRITPN